MKTESQVVGFTSVVFSLQVKQVCHAEIIICGTY